VFEKVKSVLWGRSEAAAEQGKLRRMLKKLPLPLIVLLVGFIGYFTLVKTKPEILPVENLERVWAVRTMKADYGTIIPETFAFGELRASRLVELRALVGGEIIATSENFENGARVAKGDVLAEIDPFQYQSAVDDAKAQLQGAIAVQMERKASAELAKLEKERAETLFEKGTVSKKTLDDKNVEYAIRKARLDQQAALIEREKVRLSRMQRDLKNTKIIAPFDAHVGNIMARAGRVVGLNDRVATLTSADDFEVVFNLSDDQYGRFLTRNTEIIGRPLQVFWDVGGERISMQARIRHVGAQISQATRGVDVYAIITGKLPSNLRAGAFVSIVMTSQPETDVVAIPKDALYGNDLIYVIEDGRLAPLRLADYVDIGDKLLVRSGLRQGQEILLTQFNEAAAGVAVSSFEAQ
jgi:RND family efflux transporter MFP subunit